MPLLISRHKPQISRTRCLAVKGECVAVRVSALDLDGGLCRALAAVPRFPKRAIGAGDEGLDAEGGGEGDLHLCQP